MDALAIVLAVIAIVAVAVAVWLLFRNRRSQQLREGFGPEYDRAVHESGDRRRAERALAARRQRVEALHIRPLSAEECGRFEDAWRSTQARFVDDPGAAIREADSLIGEVMQTRGYPVGDFEQRASDISVDHAKVVSNYRMAHQIALVQEQGEATTEDLRQAMVNYRVLFDELLQPGTVATAGARR